MKIAVFLMSFLTCFSLAHANELSNAVSVISTINSGSIITSTELQCLNQPVALQNHERKVITKLYNQCMVSLCGPASKNKSVWITDESIMPSSSFFLNRKIEKENALFKKIFDTANKIKLAEVDAIKEFLKTYQQNIDGLSTEQLRHLTIKTFQPYVQLSLNANAPYQDRLIVKLTPPPGASRDFISSLNSYAENLKQSSMLKSEFQQNYYTKEEVAQILNKTLLEIKTKVEKAPGLSSELKAELEFAEQIAKDQKSEKIHFESAFNSLRSIDLNLKKFGIDSNFKGVECNLPTCKRVFSTLLNSQELNANLISYENKLKDPIEQNNAIARCKASVIIAEMEESNASKARAIFKNAKELIVSNMLPNFSEHSRGILLDYLNKKLQASNRNIIKPRGRNDYVDYFSERSKDYLQKNFMISKPDALEIIDRVTSLEDEFNNIDPYENVDPCFQKGKPINAWDHFLPVKLFRQLMTNDASNLTIQKNIEGLGTDDHVFISDFSCQHADHGTHTTLHEISHALNFVFKNTKLSETSAAFYKGIRNCVRDQYPHAEVVQGPRNHENDSLFTEEDMADTLALMSNRNDRKVYACQFLRPSLVNDSYADLKFIDIQDNHSTGFTRVLMEAINKDIILPQSCEKLIKEENQDMRLKKCI